VLTAKAIFQGDTPMDIAVFGAGIAGLMSAITLRAGGQKCRLYERDSQAQEAGMGFILVPDGIACLESFGVRLTGGLSGTPLEKYCCRDSTGKVLHEQDMPAGTLGIRRRDLTAALVRALPEEEPRVFGELEGLEFDQDLQVSSATVRSSEGVRQITADLYVGAEGVNSRARQSMFPDWPTTADRVQEFVGLVRCDKGVTWAARKLNKFHAPDGGIALGIMPVDEQHVVWYLQFDSQRYPLSRGALHGDTHAAAMMRRAFIQQLVGSWGHPVPAVLANTDFSRVHLWRPVECDLVPRFHRGNLVLVGDAAHPLSPFTSQGVSSAVADAVVLAEELKAVGCKDDLAQALQRYSIRQHQRCAPYVAQGKELVQHFLKPLSTHTTVLPIAVKVDHSQSVARSKHTSAFAQEA
jgi:2-polyprenyl-6-methoxyphenol hydroxylase-like FAD-dependent oxidoreductase